MKCHSKIFNPYKTKENRGGSSQAHVTQHLTSAAMLMEWQWILRPVHISCIMQALTQGGVFLCTTYFGSHLI